MVPNYGDFDTSETVYIPFNTFDSNDPSASVTITNLAATDIHVHKDGAVAQRTSTAGFTVTINFDSITGNHLVALDLSDNTDAGFWANGSQYSVRMEGTTVDGATINAWIGSFSIGRTLRPTTAGRTLDVTATGAAGIDWGNVENPTTAVDLSGTDIQLCDTVTTLTGHTAQTGDSFARIGANGAGLSAIPWNASWDAEVQSECNDALVAYDAATGTDVSGLNDPTAATIAAAVWDEDATGHQTGGTFGQAIGDPGVNTETMYDAMVTDAAGTNVAADIVAVKAETALIVADTNELQTDDVPGLIAALNDVAATDIVSSGAITTLAGAVVNVDLVDTCTTNTDMVAAAPTAAAVADAVLDEDMTAHQSAGTLGGAIGDPAASTESIWKATVSDAAGTNVAADIIAVKAETATIVADTNKLQTDDVPGLIAALNDVSAADVNAQCDTALSDIGLQYLVNTALPTNWATDITANSALDYMADDGTAAFDRTTDSLQAMRDHIGDGTNLTEAGGTGDHLTAIDLPNQTMDITGNLSGSVGSVTGAVGSVTGAVGSVSGNVDGSVGSLGTTAKSDVNAEVVDALATDTYAEPGQGAPAATTTLAAKINYLYKNWRNRKTQDATTWELYADDATTVDQKATVSDDGTDAEKGEIVTGP